ncbi:D-alanyl-D-alanine endopeptidase (penicillin-binding protein 7) [Paraburkholderia sp. BL6669N2]|uniref:serine hydrolase n=1 Tax=Paraburkholderia sp. BL6669N2 TaxID=1938807 RepID=UPI000E22E8A5|nr:serine hydrolase [Paraburkholderia sp. BL6669N2]REG52148.1 D-alanyl-D-alanine endopeptidase (penicillin-binding protein 7) [Paraburkholderia sp. BL6669N2]
MKITLRSSLTAAHCMAQTVALSATLPALVITACFGKSVEVHAAPSLRAEGTALTTAVPASDATRQAESLHPASLRNMRSKHLRGSHVSENATRANAGVAENMTALRKPHGIVHTVAFEPRARLTRSPHEFPKTSGGPELSSSVAYVVAQKTGETLFDKNSRAVVPIASVTKLMTSMVVLDSKASLTEMIQVTDADRDYEKHTGSRLTVGSVLSRQDMLHIALMSSENRAAAALSRYFPGGRPAFIAAMNEKAKALGMADTHFESPTGLTTHNVSSARDLVKLVEAAYQYPLIRDFSTDHGYTVNTGKRLLDYHSTNALIRDPRWHIGLQKTGFINEAGICLVMQATIAGKPVVMVLLHSARRYDDFTDAETLRSFLASDDPPRATALDANRSGT